MQNCINILYLKIKTSVPVHSFIFISINIYRLSISNIFSIKKFFMFSEFVAKITHLSNNCKKYDTIKKSNILDMERGILNNGY